MFPPSAWIPGMPMPLSIYEYLDLFFHVYIFVFIHTYLYIYRHLDEYMYIYMYTYMYVYIYLQTSWWVYVHIYIFGLSTHIYNTTSCFKRREFKAGQTSRLQRTCLNDWLSGMILQVQINSSPTGRTFHVRELFWFIQIYENDNNTKEPFKLSISLLWKKVISYYEKWNNTFGTLWRLNFPKRASYSRPSQDI